MSDSAKAMDIVTKIVSKLRGLDSLSNRLDTIQEALGRIESKLSASSTYSDPRDYEFKVYSQWGEDGIIDYLVSRVELAEKSFVEFGVETYTEANTLFLLKHKSWKGLVIDGSSEHIEKIRQGQVLWKYNLRAECAFITRNNINSLIVKNGFSGDLGLLSIDIDGNDYWVWEALQCVTPRIIVAEYNSLFGPTAKISTPYKPDFFRTSEHYSNMYYGASISALNFLATRRGYTLVAGNSAGNNVFFVRNDCLGPLRAQVPEEAYVQAAFRESRSGSGTVEFLEFPQRQAAISHLPLVDVESGQPMTLKDVQ